MNKSIDCSNSAPIWSRPAATSSPRAILTVWDKEGSLRKNPGGNFEFSKFLWKDRGMAKYGTFGLDPKYQCGRCGARHDVEIEQPPPSGPYGTPVTVTITRMCNCDRPISSGQYFSIDYNSTNTKDTKVAKQFDTTEIKNTALNTIVSKVETLERALFDKGEAIRKVEALHTQKIAEASIALDRVLMEALQNGLDVEDYDNFLPEYSDDLQARVANLIELTQLANVEASV